MGDSVGGRLGAPLHLVHGLPGGSWAAGCAAAALHVAITSYHRDSAALFLKDAADAVHADAPTLTVTTAAADIVAADAPIEASRHGRLVVVAGRTMSAARAALLGSTPLAVATHAGCPVTSWRAGASAPLGGPVVVGVAYTEDGATALRTALDIADTLAVEVIAVHAWIQRTPAAAVTIPFLIDLGCPRSPRTSSAHHRRRRGGRGLLPGVCATLRWREPKW